MRRERRDLTDAVGLQRAELEPRVAAAGVARLHRDALPVAADGRGGGALVDDGCGGRGRSGAVISRVFDSSVA